MTMIIATNLANSQKVVFLCEKSKLWWKKFGHGRISIKKIAEVEKQFFNDLFTFMFRTLQQQKIELKLLMKYAVVNFGCGNERQRNGKKTRR